MQETRPDPACYEILQYSLCEGWMNNLYDSNNKPYVFVTIEDAIAELQGEFDDWLTEIERGERSEDEGYDIGTFQIICNPTSIIYDLDFIEGKVIIVSGTTIN